MYPEYERWREKMDDDGYEEEIKDGKICEEETSLDFILFLRENHEEKYKELRDEFFNTVKSREFEEHMWAIFEGKLNEISGS